MAKSSAPRSSRRGREPLVFGLLLVSLTGAGLLAFLTRGTSSSGVAVRSHAPPDGVGEATAHPVRRVEDESAPPFTSMEPAPRLTKAQADTLEQIEVPTVEQAARLQKPKAEPRRDVVEQGLLALMERPECQPPATLVETALSGVGVWGCVIETSGERAFFVGEAGHRNPSGLLEVGRYEDGERSGEWEQYFPTGVLAARGVYEAGRRDGVWEEYDEDGIHRVSRSYSEGRKHGIVLNYARSEPRVELYFNGGAYDPQSKERLPRTELAEAR